jgi:hypothetical protein
MVDPNPALRCFASALRNQPVGVTPKIHVRHDVDDVLPLRLYWLPSQTLPTVPVAAGSGLAPE